MFTLFAIPKAFRDHAGLIQRNALRSWTLLEPRPEILLFGDDEGTAEIAAELAVQHVPEVKRNRFGTPNLGDCFTLARKIAANPILCYVNADIILMNDLVDAVHKIAAWSSQFLIVGRRWDLDIRSELDFSSQWAETLREQARIQGRLGEATFMDYFVFTAETATGFPAFAVGRPFWDNWFIYHARSQKVRVVDVTDQVLVVHQNHSYAHVPAREGERWQGPEGNQNLMLAGGWLHVFTLDDCTHRLTDRGVRPAFSWRRLSRFLLRFRAFHPQFNSFVRSLKRSG